MAMELLFKTALTVAVIIVIIAVSFLVVTLLSSGSSLLTQSQAVSLISNDLKQHYTNTEITILNVSRSLVHQGSWSILARMIQGPGTPCPSVFTESFDYPATGLLNTSQVYSNYSNDMCHVYVGLNSRNGPIDNVVGLEAIAIATPLNESFPPLLSFINIYGFDNINASAMIYSNETKPGNAININGTAWFINYTAMQNNMTLHVVLSTSGKVLYNYTS